MTLAAVALLAALPAAQAASTVSVAVVDSGIDATHAEFQGRTIERHSFAQPTVPVTPPVPGLPNPFDQLGNDPDGQGTAVASKVAGRTLGQDANATLVDLQVSGHYTGTALDPATEAAAAQALDWLLANHGSAGGAGPRVAVLSFANRTLSGPGAATLAADAQKLWTDGVLLVVPDGPSDLAKSPYVLTVAGSEGPCAGPTSASSAPKPDLSAKSQQVTVAVPSSATSGLPTGAGTTAQRSGTPFAAATVAGIAAQMWAANGELPIDVLTAILRDQAQSGGCGAGIADAGAAVAAAQSWAEPFPTGQLTKPSPAPAFALILVAVLSVAAARRARRAR